MKTLVVCCDGTWNTPDQQGSPTNVTKMARAILPRAADGGAQSVYYDEGVGTGNALDRFVGGTLGVGLGQNVQQAYRFLALNYEPGAAPPIAALMFPPSIASTTAGAENASRSTRVT